VEAAAGTGKTSLMAGRVAMALASGREPRHLAAITFTELAAAELGHRIHQTVQALLQGEIPAVLAPVLPSGLSAAQRGALSLTARNLDQLTTTTIHGFCQMILRSHAVTAGLDPGTKVIDAPAAEAMFESLFSQWLSERLSGVGAEADDALVVLSQHNPLGVVKLLKELAELRRDHPAATTTAMPRDRTDTAFVDAVNEFCAGAPAIQPMLSPLNSSPTSRRSPPSIRTHSPPAPRLLSYGALLSRGGSRR
jgi:ATP-dependent exoDNAse (exonuclease V) beta subunit